MRLGAAVAGLLGVLLIALGWFRFQAGPDHLPQQFWWLAAGGSALAVSPIFLPGDLIMALFFMALPVSLAGVILWKGTQVAPCRGVASTRGPVSCDRRCAPQHHRQQADVTKVNNVADVEYEYTPGRSRVSRQRASASATSPAPASSTRSTTTASAPRAGVLRSEESRRAPCWNAIRRCRSAGSTPSPLPSSWAASRCWRCVWNISAIFDGLVGVFSREGLPAGAWPSLPWRLMLVAMLWMVRRQVRRGVGLAGHRAVASSKAASSTIASGSAARRAAAHDLL